MKGKRKVRDTLIDLAAYIVAFVFFAALFEFAFGAPRWAALIGAAIIVRVNETYVATKR